MIKKLISIIVLLGLFLLGIQSAYALETYVGIQILNLTDDPTASCAGFTGYGEQGRIRALSSIQPDFPIYFELRHMNGSVIWAGNDTEDRDYAVNDVMYLPSTVNLDLGEDYRVYMNVNALRIFLLTWSEFSSFSTDDNTYWTIGNGRSVGSLTTSMIAGSSTCSGTAVGGAGAHNLIYISNIRNSTLLNNCLNNSSLCSNPQLSDLVASGTSWSYRIDNRYQDLWRSDRGIFEFGFTFN